MKTGNLHGQFYWDIDGLIDDLKTWWAEGHPCPDIAEKLHEKYGGLPTRNAVIGKVRRLELPMRGKIPPGKPRAAAKAKIDGKPPRTTGFRPGPDVVSEKPTSIFDPCVIPAGQRRQLLELGYEHCRFPYGDVGKPDFFFCGGEKVKGYSYCAFHYRMTHTGPRYISRAEFERNRILGLRATERLRMKREASA